MTLKIKKISSLNEFNKNPEKVITNPDIYSRKTETISEDGYTEEVKRFSEDGLFSPSIFGKLDTENEYSCSCGNYTGKIFEGIVCDVCNEEVKLVEANIDKVGWVDLQEYSIIKYVSYMLLEKVIGREHLKNIIKAPDKITIEGDIDYEEVEEIRAQSVETKHYNIGILEFRDKYQEVLDYYFGLNNSGLIDDKIDPIEEEIKKTMERMNTFTQYRNKVFNLDILNEIKESIKVLPDTKDGKILKELVKKYETLKKKKERRLYDLLRDPDNVFTSKILVLSTVMRPAMRTSDGLKMDSLNNIYINILTSVNILQDRTNNNEISKIITLQGLQAQYFQLSEEIMNNIKSKGGLIRNQIMG